MIEQTNVKVLHNLTAHPPHGQTCMDIPTCTSNHHMHVT